MGIEVPYSKDEINNAQEATIKNEHKIWLCSPSDLEGSESGYLCAEK